MSNEKISSLELASVISEQTGVTKKNATAFMRQFAETIESALLNDGIVKIKGFGTFKITWNESRSSVNVQTGERYEIAGHNKITFTPDDELRDSVNLPYAHLSSSLIDGSAETKLEENPEEDPHMKRFSEQATEIMSIIADMQGLKPRKKTAPTVALPQSEPVIEKAITPEPESDSIAKAIQDALASITDNQEPIAEKEAEIQETAADTIQSKKATHVDYAKSATSLPNSAVTSSPMSDTIESALQDVMADTSLAMTTKITEADLVNQMSAQPSTQTKKWLLIALAIVILLGGLGVAAYFFIPTFSNNQPAKPVNVSQPVKPVIHKTSPVTAPKDTLPAASVNKEEAEPKQQEHPKQESPQDIFSTPRKYTKLIATEVATEGTYLTILAQKYYGHKLFWVYIYEANKDKLHDPGLLPPGTKIRIPELDPRLIDKYDGRCFRQASALQTKYTTK